MPLQTAVGQYGYIYWDIPRVMYYRPGDEIKSRLWIGNTSPEPMNLMIRTRLIKSGSIQSEGIIRVNDAAWFSLDGYESTEITGSIISEISDSILSAELVDSNGNVIASTYAQLVTPTQIQYTGPQPVQPITDTTTQMVSLLVIMLMMMMLMRMVTLNA